MTKRCEKLFSAGGVLDGVVTSNYMNKICFQSNGAGSEHNCKCTKEIVLIKSCLATTCYRQYVKLLDFHEYYCVIIVSKTAQFKTNHKTGKKCSTQVGYLQEQH